MKTIYPEPIELFLESIARTIVQPTTPNHCERVQATAAVVCSAMYDKKPETQTFGFLFCAEAQLQV